MDRIAREYERNKTSKPHPHINVGSSRGATQRAPTHPAKQQRSSLSPRPVKNQTLKKRGSPGFSGLLGCFASCEDLRLRRLLRSRGPRPGPLGQSAEDKRVANNKERKAIQAVRPGQAEQSHPIASANSEMDRIARGYAPNKTSKPHPHIEAGSSRGTSKRAPTHQAKQASSSLLPRPVKNRTIKKRGSPGFSDLLGCFASCEDLRRRRLLRSRGPRPGPLGQSAEDKRVANKQRAQSHQSPSGEDNPSSAKRRPPKRNGPDR